MRIKSSPDRRESHETFRRCDYIGGGGGMRRCVRNAFVPLFSPFPGHPFLPSSPLSDPPASRFRRKPVLPPREGALRDNANRYLLRVRTVLPYAPFFLRRVRQVSFRKSYNRCLSLSRARAFTDATPRRWRTCEYPIFAASHFPSSCLYLIFRADPRSFLSLPRSRFFPDVCPRVNYSAACFPSS